MLQIWLFRSVWLHIPRSARKLILLVLGWGTRGFVAFAAVSGIKHALIDANGTWSGLFVSALFGVGVIISIVAPEALASSLVWLLRLVLGSVTAYYLYSGLRESDTELRVTTLILASVCAGLFLISFVAVRHRLFGRSRTDSSNGEHTVAPAEARNVAPAWLLRLIFGILAAVWVYMGVQPEAAGHEHEAVAYLVTGIGAGLAVIASIPAVSRRFRPFLGGGSSS
jgi:uncharacterized membrane protein